MSVYLSVYRYVYPGFPGLSIYLPIYLSIYLRSLLFTLLTLFAHQLFSLIKGHGLNTVMIECQNFWKYCKMSWKTSGSWDFSKKCQELCQKLWGWSTLYSKFSCKIHLYLIPGAGSEHLLTFKPLAIRADTLHCNHLS